jgi:acetyl-CoA acyltransferase
MAAAAITAAIKRAPGLTADEIDDVILGCAMPEFEQGMDVARVALLRAGLPETVPGLTLNRFCASGLEAIATGAAKIATGQADTVIAGGTESMTMVQFMGDSTRPNPSLMEHKPDTYLSMGLSVERLAVEFEITREQADEFSLRSHQKALAAQDEGRFDAEITPMCVETTEPDGDVMRVTRTTFERDEGPRRDTSLEALGRLKPAFSAEGTITAGNASQRSDGAAAVTLTTTERAKQLGIAPLARFVDYVVCSVAPERFGVAPAYAIPKLLERNGLTIDQIDLIEFNEAFAAQVLASNRVYPLPMERVNVNGGAVALGHPLGATGARQTVTVLYEARRRGSKYVLVAMCAALGMGAAGLFEIYD